MRRLLALLLLQAALLAGGGPETTLLVVNVESPVSRRVAHEYAELRDLPPSHVVPVDGVPPFGVIELDLFLERIWRPVEERMAQLGGPDAIRLVTYSADLPFAVDFRHRAEGMQHARASLTGVTYLVRHVVAGEEFWGLQINPYYGLSFETRRATEEERALALRGARAMEQQRYAEAADLFAELVASYDTSANAWFHYARALAKLGRAGEALDALDRAVGNGFRSAPLLARTPELGALRGEPRYQELQQRLAAGEVGAPVSVLPSRAFDLDGYYLATQLGYTGRFGNSVPEILAYLRAAAAADGTRPDGTVYFCRNGDIRSKTREPFYPALEAELKRRGRKVELVDGVLPAGRDDVVGAILGRAGFRWESAKARILPGGIVEHLTSHGANFSTPGQTKISELLRHGAAGSSGTVTEPFAIHQKFPNPLLHVFYADGCSLAEAFYRSVWGPYQLMVAGDGLARPFARFSDVEADAPPGPWSGRVRIGGGAEVWVDGRRLEGDTIDGDALDEGWHEVRVVAIADDPVATRSYTKLAATVGRRELETERIDGGVRLHAPGARAYELWWGGRAVAGSEGGELAFPDLGPGRVTFLPRALFPDGSVVRGAPVVAELAPPPLVAAGELPRPAKPGLRGFATDAAGQRRPVVVTAVGDHHGGRRLRELCGDAAALEVEGWFRVARDGVHQLHVKGTARVGIDGAAPAEGSYHLFGAAAGWHRLRVETDAPGGVELLLGGDQVLAPLELRHFTFPAVEQAPAVDEALALTVDGNRAGKGVPLPDEGLVLRYPRPLRRVAAVTVFPGEGVEAFPLEWEVEVTTGGKWRPVKELRRVAAPPAARGEKRPEIPLFVELSFAPERVKKLRLTVKGRAEVAEVEVLQTPKR